MKMKRTIIACFALSLASGACSLGSATTEPRDLLLSPTDVDVAYSAEEADDAVFVLNDCLVNNLGQRVEGARSASISFDASAAGDAFLHSVSTTGDRDPIEVLGEIQQLIADCEPDSTVSMSGDLIMSTTYSRQLVDGPALGERSIWIAGQLQVSDSAGVSGDDRPPSPSVVFVQNGAIHRLTAPVILDWEEGIDFIVEHADKL